VCNLKPVRCRVSFEAVSSFLLFRDWAATFEQADHCTDEPAFNIGNCCSWALESFENHAGGKEAHLVDKGTCVGCSLAVLKWVWPSTPWTWECTCSMPRVLYAGDQP
jgi:hypothetical protein